MKFIDCHYLDYDTNKDVYPFMQLVVLGGKMPLDPADADAAFARYGEVYQPTTDGRAPIWAKRHG